jgi:hypothetical protein
MDRNGVVLDGTANRGRPQCSSATADQDVGPLGPAGAPAGRNGLIVFKASGVSVENLTACNFLSGADTPGDEIWFDGGGSSGTQQIGSWRGAFLSATSSYFAGENEPLTQYGIFASNTFGPGLFTQVYANNQGDAAFYIGARTATILDHAHGQNSAQGYSGTNSGGHLIIQNSEFDHNHTGSPPTARTTTTNRRLSPAAAPVTRPVRLGPVRAGCSRTTRCTTTTTQTCPPAQVSSRFSPVGTRRPDLRRPVRHRR